jgi:hypothetical protein
MTSTALCRSAAISRRNSGSISVARVRAVVKSKEEKAGELHNDEGESEDDVPLEEIEQILRDDAASIKVQPLDAKEFLKKAMRRREKERVVEREMKEKLREYFAEKRKKQEKRDQ